MPAVCRARPAGSPQVQCGTVRALGGGAVGLPAGPVCVDCGQVRVNSAGRRCETCQGCYDKEDATLLFDPVFPATTQPPAPTPAAGVTQDDPPTDFLSRQDKSTPVYPGGAASVPVAEQLTALEAELAALKLGKLSKRAAATAGIDEDAVEAALDDDDDPKAALIALLLAHVEGSFH